MTFMIFEVLLECNIKITFCFGEEEINLNCKNYPSGNWGGGNLCAVMINSHFSLLYYSQKQTKRGREGTWLLNNICQQETTRDGIG